MTDWMNGPGPHVIENGRLAAPTAEQQARNLLERLDVPGAQSYTAGDLVELANLIARCAALEQALKDFAQEANLMSVRLANSVVTPESLRAMLSTPSEEPKL